MKRIFIFDVDGTLTPSGLSMGDEMSVVLRQFIQSHPVFLLADSSYETLQEQVPEDILIDCDGVFTNMGSQLWLSGKPVYSHQHDFDHDLLLLTQHFVDSSPYPYRKGAHIEELSSMLIVSILGRKATTAQRNHYNQWDAKVGERKRLVELVNSSDLDYEANLKGEISISITPKECNKASVLNEVQFLKPNCVITFFGDQIHPGGEDYQLAIALREDSECHTPLPVKNFVDTLACLQDLMKQDMNSTAA